MRLIASLLAFLSFSAYGQDYLVLNNGDTLRGRLKPLFYDKLDRVQISIDKKKKTYAATQVRTMSYQGDIYNPQGMENSIRFMKLMKPGYLSLYAFRLENQNTFGGRYLVKKDGRAMEVPNLTFKKSMSAFLQDVPEVVDKIKSGKYGKSDLYDIIDDFNAIIEANTSSQKAMDSAFKKSKQPLIFLDTLKANVERQPDFASKKDALDMMTDMHSKLAKGETPSHYMLDGLKGLLETVEPVKDDLEKFLASIKE